MPMNDPHVKALHYSIKHDNSVAYSAVEPLVHDDPLFLVRAKQRNVVLEPKGHYATEEGARRAAEGFVRRWEFEAALRAQSGVFRLVYERAHIVERNPPRSPPGTVNAGATRAEALAAQGPNMPRGVPATGLPARRGSVEWGTPDPFPP